MSRMNFSFFFLEFSLAVFVGAAEAACHVLRLPD
jgi:hypothetical protein